LPGKQVRLKNVLHGDTSALHDEQKMHERMRAREKAHEHRPDRIRQMREEEGDRGGYRELEMER
jgi:hypothetical protein